MGREPLNLQHRALVEEKFEQLNIPLSEYNFANLYLFRHVHKPHLLTGERNFIEGITYDKKKFLLPLEEISQDTSCYIPYLKEGALLFPLIDTALFPSEDFAATYLEEDSDYIYTAEKLRTFSGRHLSSRRNLLKQFVEEYDSTIKPLVDNPEDAEVIVDVWKKEARDGEEDAEACREAVHLMKELSLEGIIVYVDSEPVGICIGSHLNQDHFLFQFSKAKKGFKGIYQYLYQEMAKRIDRHFMMIDLEQDLGLPGLRQAKKAYDPDVLAKKWRVGLK